jgi:hypothetical protein
MYETPEERCHELLLRLAGRLPDIELWRYRDWLDNGAMTALARVLPRTLLHHRLGLTELEHLLLIDALIPFGAEWAALHSVIGLDASPECDYTFTTERSSTESESDVAWVVLTAALRGRRGVDEVRCCWRHHQQRSQRGGDSHKRVVLLTASTEFARLTGEVHVCSGH